MQNKTNKPVSGETPTPRALDPHNESNSFFDDAAIARIEEIEKMEDKEERLVQLNFFVLRQASFLPTSELNPFRANVGAIVELLGLEITPNNTTFQEIQNIINATNPKKRGEFSDGFHTFNELYEFQKAFNAALFNEWAKQGLYDTHKSWKHSDGNECFGGGWFIVVAQLPTGQISNHYPTKDWDDFKIPEVEQGKEWDGHTAQDVLKRISELYA